MTRRQVLADLSAIAALALAVRLVVAQAVVTPPADDPAFYVTVARNLHAGRGFVTDVVWQYQAAPEQITHAAGDLWMPLPSVLMALAFALGGASWPVAQVPGLVAGVGLPVLTYLVGRRVLAPDVRCRLLSVAAAALVCLNGVLAYQSASGDSSALFGLLAAAALWLQGGAATARSGEESGADGRPSLAARRRRNLAAGALLGLAYLARSDALFVLAGIAVVLLWPRNGEMTLRDRLAGLAVVAGSAAAVAAPWLVRNLIEFGTPTPVPAAFLASLTRYEDLFRYAPAGATWRAPEFGEALSIRIAALWHNWHQVLGFLFYPTAVLPILGLVLRRDRPGVWDSLAALGLTLGLTAVVFPVPTLAGTFYHDAGAFAPWLAVGLVWLAASAVRALGKWRRWGVDHLSLALGPLLVVTVAQLILTTAAVTTQHQAEERRLVGAAAELSRRPPGPVITTSPYNLHLRTGLPALMLPVGQKKDTLLALAGRYSARYVVVLGRFGLYPDELAGSEDCRSAPAAGRSICLAADGGEWQLFQVN